MQQDELVRVSYVKNLLDWLVVSAKLMFAHLFISSLRMERVRNVQNIRENKEMEKFVEQINVHKNKRLI